MKTEDLEVIDVDDGVRGVGEHGAELSQPGSGGDDDEDVDMAEYLISSGWDLITNLTLWSWRSK